MYGINQDELFVEPKANLMCEQQSIEYEYFILFVLNEQLSVLLQYKLHPLLEKHKWSILRVVLASNEWIDRKFKKFM